VRARPGRVPAWAGRPASADKLEDLETWLAGEGLGYEDYWLIEGELQLAEGRAHLARDREGAKFARDRARAGFESVHGNARATDGQRQRAELGLQGLAAPVASAVPASFGALVARTRWGAQPPNPRLLDPAADPWRWITVHHSAMPGHRPASLALEDSAAALREIQAAHMNGEGFGDIGYHYLIDGAGRVFAGRDLRYQGAHAGDEANRGNLGICLLGNFEEERPTAQALASLDALIAEFSERYHIPPGHVKPHGYWKSTACPGRHLLDHLARYR